MMNILHVALLLSPEILYPSLLVYEMVFTYVYVQNTLSIVIKVKSSA